MNLDALIKELTDLREWHGGDTEVNIDLGSIGGGCAQPIAPYFDPGYIDEETPEDSIPNYVYLPFTNPEV